MRALLEVQMQAQLGVGVEAVLVAVLAEIWPKHSNVATQIRIGRVRKG